MRLMLVAVLVAAAVGYALARFFLAYPRSAAGYQHLSRREVHFLTRAGEALFPPGGEIPESGAEADVAVYVDRFVGASHPRMRRLMRMLFFLMEQATFFLPAPGRGGMRRFSSLSLPQREAVIEAWSASRFFARRIVFSSLRAILTMAYLNAPAVMRRLRVAPYAIETPICEADLLYPRIGRGPESIPYTRADLGPPSDGTPLDLDGPLLPAYREEAG